MAARRPWWIVGVWLVLAVVFGRWAGLAPDRLQAGSGDVPGSTSVQVDRMLAKDFANPYIQSLVLAVRSRRQPTDSPAIKALLVRIEQALRASPDVRAVMLPEKAIDSRLVADPAKGAMVLIGLKAQDVHGAELAIPGIRQAVDQVMTQTKSSDPTLTWGVTGRAAYTFDLNKFNAADIGEAEGRVVPVTLIILIVGFGALVAAGLPMIMGILATGVSMGVIYLLTGSMPISNLAQNAVTMIGLAVGIDYSLFVVYRFREIRAQTADVTAALMETMATAGKSVAYSGLTVVIGMLGLMVTPLLETQSVGIGGCIVVIVSVLLAVTFLPALLALLGPWLDSPRWLSRRLVRSNQFDWWHGLARQVMARPWRISIVCLAVLVAMSLPGLGTRFGFPVGRWLPDSMEAVRGTDMLIAMEQGGLVAPVNVVIRTKDRSPILAATSVPPLRALSRKLRADARVADIYGPVDLASGLSDLQYLMLYQQPEAAFSQYPAIRQFMVSTDRSAVLVQVLIKPDVELHQAKDLAQLIPHWVDMPGTEVLVGGQAAYYVDFDNALQRSFPLAMGIVLVATFVALAVAFRSVLIPLKAVLMNILSVTAGYGAMVLVFQEGYGGQWLGLSAPTQAVPVITPVLLFCIVFGLSMDYEVFLLSRIKEAYDRLGDNTAATAEGLAATGRIITSAALIMVAVFGGFALARVAVVKMLGFGLAVSVLVDATIIRCVLVPALMRLLGRWNWWPGTRRPV
ncbi:MAG: MMPL family transporter [Candidatus Sericytochromatia bacterium]|nr:MMPL family transporter [Candidatus Sericytochromatia bacterium]